jgi:hypothetical protein
MEEIRAQARKLRERRAGRGQDRDLRRGNHHPAGHHHRAHHHAGLRHAQAGARQGEMHRVDHGHEAARTLAKAPANGSSSAASAKLEHCLSQARIAFARNRFAEALGRYRAGMLLGSQPEEHAHERWMCLMMLGRFDLAWQETDRTEARRKVRKERMEHLPPHMRRVWDGTPVAGTRVLVRCYHGLGDTIQFARYIPVLRGIAQSVTLQAQESLAPLIQSIAGIDRILSLHERAEDVDFDVELELMELPYIFRSNLATIPAAVPYLHVPAEKVKQRQAEMETLGARTDVLRVGLVWSSGDWNPDRNLDLWELRHLAGIEGVQLFSLQRGDAAHQLRAIGSILPAERQSGTVMDTAAAILNLELIISVDTMVAHLAGALGKPVWLLLPFSADWRWMAAREDSPWYPTMRLFRQTRPGDWKRVIERLTLKLLRLKNGTHAFRDQTSSGSSSIFSESP